MLESRDYSPKVYTESRDYQAILKLLDLINCNEKSDIDNFISYLNPEYCKSEYLEHLASYIGYKYDNFLSYEDNRLIISHFQNLVNNRGSETGIKLAASLAINLVKLSAGDNQLLMDLSTSLVDIGFDQDEGVINIYVFSDNYSLKIFDLIEVVRPAGVRVKVFYSQRVSSYDKINVEEDLSSTKEAYDVSKRSTVGTTDVGFGEVST